MCHVGFDYPIRGGGIVRHKRSAKIFVIGICLWIGGPVLVVVGSSLVTLPDMSGPTTSENVIGVVSLTLMIAGALVHFLGYCFLAAAVIRALLKIDTRPDL